MRRRIVLLGPPASGKGTQAELMKARYGLPVASPGAILREEKCRGTALGIEADRLTSQGCFVPDATVIGLMEVWLARQPDGFVFDGFPRSVPQADGLEGILTQHGRALDVALSLETPVETLRARVDQRLLCDECGQTVAAGLHVPDAASPCPVCRGRLSRRNDDTQEVLGRRLEEYRLKSEPLVSYYEQRGLLQRVTSTGAPEIVFAEISAILERA